ncbi:c-type cytochrome [Mucilaginibacter sp.]|uniref:c-type cytochrome n=1 Tax=Mucilaginibacter sp. TaxID=1882438 RepID=UPI003D0D851F
MKKIFIVLAICAVITACGGSSKPGDGDSTTAANQTAKSAETNADTNATKTGTEKDAGALAPGAKLMAAADCNTCHKEDVKVVGPALKDIAAKYPATDENITTLANKVIAGGKGNWGDIPMSAHPSLSVSDAKTMVTYILSLKK